MTEHLTDTLNRMRRDWDSRARANSRHFVATDKLNWSDDEFFESGREAVRGFILSDMGNICQGKDPAAMRERARSISPVLSSSTFPHAQ